jgi:GT2 family glycosyltransferase
MPIDRFAVFAHALRGQLRKMRFGRIERFRGRRLLATVLRVQYGPDIANAVEKHLARHSPFEGSDRRNVTGLADEIRAAYAGRCGGAEGRAVDVSIIVPVYNALHLTLGCLESLLSQNSKFEFEVLIADDGSTDGTAELLRNFGAGVRVVCNAGRKGFLGNCNHAATSARGRFLVFLNNDTVVLPGWLDELVAALRNGADIGLAGSRMISLNGKLQEAGSFVFSNGRTARYGSKDDPTKEIYNRSRDTDFISGASIAVPAHIWRELGGFDECFSPGYYEDVDLAFRVRGHGFRVVYCPKSTVIHFGKLSFGTSAQDVAATSRQTFVEKWASELRLRPAWPGKNDKGEANKIIALRELQKPL